MRPVIRLRPVANRAGRRGQTITLAVTAGVVCVGAAFVSLPKIWMWNATPSVPVGLYHLNEPRQISAGTLLVVTLPEEARRIADQRGYLPKTVPLLKPVAAIAGQTVCRSGLSITVDGRTIGEARHKDRRQRPLPVWSGCRVLAPGQLFLMNPARPDSFDGRYFGPIDDHAVRAIATPVYTNTDGHWRLHPRAPRQSSANIGRVS